MCVKIKFLLIVCLLNFSIDNLNALGWPECGEFVFPKDEINLSTEEKQFKQKLPPLFESYDCGNASSFQTALKSLGKFKLPFTSDKKSPERQTISASLEIVSILKFDIKML